MVDKVTRLLATFFYLGYSPLAPGSIASLAGAIMCIILRPAPQIYILAFLVITVIGFVVSGRMEKIAKDKDPSCVVIDEVAGSFIAFFLLPPQPVVFITAFFLFRAFDMFKIYPANKLEDLHGSVGIMTDDLVAGVYTCLIMHLALRIPNFF